MELIKDIIIRSFYLSLFIIPLPIGAYTIHNGSSAVVALVSYIVLAFIMPFFYLRSPRSGFGPKKKHISIVFYWLSWLFLQGITYLVSDSFDLDFLWNFPSLARDITFILVMYGQVVMSMLLGYVLTRICTKEERS